MDVTLLEKFENEIKSIRNYVTHIEQINEIVSSDITGVDSESTFNLITKFTLHFHAFRTQKRVFEYKSIIISLYGLIERYSEIWISNYLEYLAKLVGDYSKIDESIREHHFGSSIRLLTIMSSKDYSKYSGLTKEGILNRLNLCLTSPINFEFNPEAFVINNGNLKHAKIVELFKGINIDLNRGLKNNVFFKNFLATTLNSNIDSLPNDVLYQILDDVVERRNIISHGSEEITDILDLNILTEYITFVENYCTSLFNVLLHEFCKEECRWSFSQVFNLHGIWHHSIIGFDLVNSEIKKGEYIIVEHEGWFTRTKIIGIQVNHIEVSGVRSRLSIAVAIKVSLYLTNRAKIYLRK
jgi:hypothetical protein